VEVGRPSEVDEIFDAISYSKGASVIRMLHQYIGDVVGDKICVCMCMCVCLRMPVSLKSSKGLSLPCLLLKSISITKKERKVGQFDIIMLLY
jgi:hypothetical protein